VCVLIISKMCPEWMKKMKIKNKDVKKIFVIGLPNTGKSQIFNNLTRNYSMVANSLLTTIEIKKGYLLSGNINYEIFDTPGLHSLYVHSEEELVVRDMLLSESPDFIIQCIDANRLKQSLILTADLLELGIPVVISLNAIDETVKKGFRIDANALADLLGIPIVESMAIDDNRSLELVSHVEKGLKSKHDILYDELLEKGIELVQSKLPENIIYKRKVAILMLQNDPFIENVLGSFYPSEKSKEIRDAVDWVITRFKGNINRTVNYKKNIWIDEIVEKVIHKQRVRLKSFSHTFAQLSRHPIFGVPILLMILGVIFFSVVNVANVMAEWMTKVIWLPIENSLNGLITSVFLRDFLVGDYGVLTFGVANAILTVLPILTVFFILFNILEDIGYIPNLCVLSKNISEKVGLSANAILPITLGFGCKTMATLTTRTLKTKKERHIAIYLIAFAIPCAPQMALNMSILGRMGARAFLIVFFVLAFVEISAGVILNKMMKTEKKIDFIQALPDIRMPNLKAVLRKTYYRLVSFLKESMPVFIYAALTFFTIDRIGLLDIIKDILKPVIVGFLGFPLQMVDVLILCMARQEAAAGMIIKLVQQGKLDYVQCIVAVTLTTMFVPCFANIMAMIKELGTKVALSMVFVINTTSFIIGGVLNWVLISVFKF